MKRTVIIMVYINGPINVLSECDSNKGKENSFYDNSDHSISNTYGSPEVLNFLLNMTNLPKKIQELATDLNTQNMFMIGYYFDVGIPEESFLPDTTQAIFWYINAAKKDHIIANLNLGILYETGHQHATTQNYPEAIYWYHRAAKLDHSGAFFNLGRLFWSGNGCNQNHALAFKLFKKAANKENVMSMTNIGAMYMSGNGVTANMEKAFWWLTQAANKGNSVAHHNIGILYENGYGCTKNLELANIHFGFALDPDTENSVTEAMSGILRRSKDPLIFT